ncbi:hypothetical protein [Cupriavidus alkaliphilus]|uniref:Uncharacterized protein n=1 Tax=Cupriavidus alkaliphilus TaxID=942866 RepID=A0A7W4YT95_9BURK|nr:hypothetical protein [Cupriavidus alkaliphilus]MBB3010665.1 hypothetical protein [Cupriavidus alkaliphilus]
MNCKPGDLAITTTRGRSIDVATPGILGRVVEVVRAASSHEVFVSTAGARFQFTGTSPAWVVKSRDLLPWKSGAGPNAGQVHFFHERPVQDAVLLPLGGVPVHDEQHDEVPA